MRWLCAAHEKEIPGFHDFARGGWITHALGVGQFASLAELARLVAAERPEGILLAGTCGSLAAGDTLQLFQCQHFSVASVAGEELPEFLPRAAETEPAISFAGLRRASVLQNHGISTDAEKFSRNTGYIPPEYPRPFLENMEAASLAFFCAEKKIPFTALLCVTNTIGPGGRQQWKENFQKAGEILHRQLGKELRLTLP